MMDGSWQTVTSAIDPAISRRINRMNLGRQGMHMLPLCRALNAFFRLLNAMSELRMVVGLGNPGPQYRSNRHNIGFQVLELLAARHGIAIDRLQQKAMIGIGFAVKPGLRQKILLVKPLTYMNASGEAVVPLMRYYRVAPAEMIVVHDDLDLAAGKLRLRKEGSSGGQNGIRSIIDRLGSQEFARVKIGIGRPPGRMAPADYVLQNFSADEESFYGPLRERAVDAIACWLFDGIDMAMNRFNG